jgi:hypothetical protein
MSPVQSVTHVSGLCPLITPALFSQPPPLPPGEEGARYRSRRAPCIDVPTSHHHGPDRRLAQALARIAKTIRREAPRAHNSAAQPCTTAASELIPPSPLHTSSLPLHSSSSGLHIPFVSWCNFSRRLHLFLTSLCIPSFNSLGKRAGLHKPGNEMCNATVQAPTAVPVLHSYPQK